MKGKKTSNEKKAEIVSEYLENPSQKSVRKVAKETGVSKTAAHNALKEVRTVRTPSIEDLYEISFRNAIKARQITEKKMEIEDSELALRDLTAVAADSLKTIQLLRGEATERTEHTGRIDFSGMSQEELEEYLLKQTDEIQS